MTEQIEKLPATNRIRELLRVQSSGCVGTYIDGWSVRGKPAVPDASVLEAYLQEHRITRQKFPQAKQALFAMMPFYDYGSMLDAVVRSPMTCYVVDVVNEKQLATQFPNTSEVVSETPEYTIVHVNYKGALTRLNKKASRESSQKHMEDITQSCSALIKKYGGVDKTSLSWLQAPGMQSGGFILARRR